MFSKKLIAIDVAINTKNDAIDYLIDLAYRAGYLSNADIFKGAVLEREASISTNVGLGVAIPHGKSQSVSDAFIAMIRPVNPIQWDDDSKDEAVGLIFLIGVSEDSDTLHLKYISEISKMLIHADFRQKLHDAASVREIYTLFTEKEHS
ncbi:PTS sugar transporter subunit IIA [Erysipelothrix aquatica]|uniref:PTS sugar transporter subunit IIA n=1 Tax=Erysipelothrix aquatica TaxID=2683714 RepID=UPI001357F8D1|nr:PTS sugar transporter subunit IIA [Erysipelothrix aquatica]